MDAYPDVIEAMKQLDYDTNKIEVLIHQFVTITKDNKPIKMSTRKANFITLEELCDEVGSEVVRYFFIMRHFNSHLNFELEIAKNQSDLNPIFYIQYAHARICNIIKKAKDLEADIVIATPECMKSLGQLGRVLGPKNLMPNPKEGTVTKNIAQAVEKAKKGQIRYKIDKAGIIHTTVGKLDFETTQLTENIKTLINDLIKVKPSSIKGKYMQNLTLSSTMGPGIKVDLSTIAEGSS